MTVGLVINIGSAMIKGDPVDWGKVRKDAAWDFAVGAASSGLAVSQKFAKAAELANHALKYTNMTSVKIITAASAEVAKSTYNGENLSQTGLSAATNAVLNATGALGKLSSNLLGKSGAKASQALFQPSKMETLAASAIIEARAGVVVGGAIDYVKNQLATPTTSGTQNMSNYASPTIGMDSGVPWGTNLLGDYTSSGILSCRKCQF